ncbi:MAG: hypothetical protein K9W46_13145 [Candidatus Heimdallarchaeum endolithica]|uniref:Uncharacterized protein n=1 Tax=Candidatus Heimdallarchaeum endolithica TaxID=2876572 RepID=A0A9Y1BQR2_9ARCH|nr:MAG: hypothetical protein K9W46_13145 [Candidatus Heimdallarchaeum endolithica]
MKNKVSINKKIVFLLIVVVLIIIPLQNKNNYNNQLDEFVSSNQFLTDSVDEKMLMKKDVNEENFKNEINDTEFISTTIELGSFYDDTIKYSETQNWYDFSLTNDDLIVLYLDFYGWNIESSKVETKVMLKIYSENFELLSFNDYSYSANLNPLIQLELKAGKYYVLVEKEKEENSSYSYMITVKSSLEHAQNTKIDNALNVNIGEEIKGDILVNNQSWFSFNIDEPKYILVNFTLENDLLLSWLYDDNGFLIEVDDEMFSSLLSPGTYYIMLEGLGNHYIVSYSLIISEIEIQSFDTISNKGRTYFGSNSKMNYLAYQIELSSPSFVKLTISSDYSTVLIYNNSVKLIQEVEDNEGITLDSGNYFLIAVIKAYYDLWSSPPCYYYVQVTEKSVKDSNKLSLNEELTDSFSEINIFNGYELNINTSGFYHFEISSSLDEYIFLVYDTNFTKTIEFEFYKGYSNTENTTWFYLENDVYYVIVMNNDYYGNTGSYNIILYYEETTQISVSDTIETPNKGIVLNILSPQLIKFEATSDEKISLIMSNESQVIANVDHNSYKATIIHYVTKGTYYFSIISRTDNNLTVSVTTEEFQQLSEKNIFVKQNENSRWYYQKISEKSYFKFTSPKYNFDVYIYSLNSSQRFYYNRYQLDFLILELEASDYLIKIDYSNIDYSGEIEFYFEIIDSLRNAKINVPTSLTSYNECFTFDVTEMDFYYIYINNSNFRNMTFSYRISQKNGKILHGYYFSQSGMIQSLILLSPGEYVLTISPPSTYVIENITFTIASSQDITDYVKIGDNKNTIQSGKYYSSLLEPNDVDIYVLTVTENTILEMSFIYGDYYYIQGNRFGLNIYFDNGVLLDKYTDIVDDTCVLSAGTYYIMVYVYSYYYVSDISQYVFYCTLNPMKLEDSEDFNVKIFNEEDVTVEETITYDNRTALFILESTEDGTLFLLFDKETNLSFLNYKLVIYIIDNNTKMTRAYYEEDIDEYGNNKIEIDRIEKSNIIIMKFKFEPCDHDAYLSFFVSYHIYQFFERPDLANAEKITFDQQLNVSIRDEIWFKFNFDKKTKIIIDIEVNSFILNPFSSYYYQDEAVNSSSLYVTFYSIDEEGGTIYLSHNESDEITNGQKMIVEATFKAGNYCLTIDPEDFIFDLSVAFHQSDDVHIINSTSGKVQFIIFSLLIVEGFIFYITGNFEYTERGNFEEKISYDGGRTWHHSRYLNEVKRRSTALPMKARIVALVIGATAVSFISYLLLFKR